MTNIIVFRFPRQGADAAESLRISRTTDWCRRRRQWIRLSGVRVLGWTASGAWRAHLLGSGSEYELEHPPTPHHSFRVLGRTASGAGRAHLLGSGSEHEIEHSPPLPLNPTFRTTACFFVSPNLGLKFVFSLWFSVQFYSDAETRLLFKWHKSFMEWNVFLLSRKFFYHGGWIWLWCQALKYLRQWISGREISNLTLKICDV